MGYRDSVVGTSPSLYWPLNDTYGATDQSGNGRNGTAGSGIQIGATDSSYKSLIVSHTPVLYWPLDATYGANDQSGNSRNGTANGGVSPGGASGSPIPGESTSTEYDSSDDRITSSFNQGTSFSVSGWAWRDVADDLHSLFSDAGGQNAPWCFVWSDAVSADSVVFRPDGNLSGVTWFTVWPGENQWVHWAVVFDDATNFAELFLNGVSQGTKTPTDATGVSASGFQASAPSAQSPWDGKQAHVAVWQRALTTTEILQQYQANPLDASPISDESTSTDFDSNNDNVQVSYDPYTDETVRSYAVWAYRDNSTSANIIFGSSSSSGTRLDLPSATNNVRWRANGTSGSTITWTNAWPGNRQWVYCVLVFDEPNNTASLYINGTLVSTQTDTNIYFSTGNFRLGTRGTSDSFDGKMAHAAVWERGLSAAEIQNLYDHAFSIPSDPTEQGPGLTGVYGDIKKTPHQWSFFLADSESLDYLADISNEIRAKQFSLALNQPGSFSFTIPFETEWKEYIVPREFSVIAKKDKTVVWSGPIWGITERWADAKLDVSCAGWFQFILDRFFTESDITKTNTNEGVIVYDLLEIANTQTINGIPRPTWVVEGTNTSDHSRTITFSRWQNIGEEIINMTNLEAGLDFDIDPVTRELNISEWDDYEDNEEAIFGFNWGPRNVRDVQRTIDSEAMGNEWFIIGTQSIAESYDEDSVDQYNLRQKVLNLNEVGDASILAAIANAEVTVNKEPRVTVDFEPLTEATANPAVPSLWTDYNLGDQVYLTARRHGKEINGQPIRIFGVNFTIDENGNEQVSSIQTSFQSA